MTELPLLENNIWKVYKTKGVEVLGLNYQESAATVKNVISQKGLTFPNLLDTSGSIYWAYGDGYIPYNVVLDQNFKVLYTASGYSEAAIISQIQSHLSSVFVNLTPDSYTVKRGSKLGFTIKLTNNTASPKTVDVWVDEIQPGHVLKAIGKKLDVTIPANGTASKHVAVPIPSNAQVSTQYWMRTQIGDYNTIVSTSDIFNFQVTN